ncbi:hypothetical protein DF049_05550 [Burkholderia cenocepacia]|nr:hypothetical protein DF049_05550 [Burkholderia cenocepacia]
MKNGGGAGRPVAPRIALCAVVSPGCERLADSAAQRPVRCERNDVRRHPAARKRPTDRPATTRRSPAETRHKKSNKYFMREIL